MTNKYAGPCADCGCSVAKRAGTLEKFNGKWIVFCSDCTDSVPQERSMPNQDTWLGEDYPCSDAGYEDQCARACGF